jgi:hypothetical protein
MSGGTRFQKGIGFRERTGDGAAVHDFFGGFLYDCDRLSRASKQDAPTSESDILPPQTTV